MSQSTQDSTLQSSELRTGYSVTYAGRFVCAFQRSPQDFYFCHSPSRGEWERDHVKLTKIQSSRWLSQCHSTVNSVNDHDFIFFLRSDQFQLAVQSRNKGSVPLLDAVCQSSSTVDSAYYSFDGCWFQVKSLFSKSNTNTSKIVWLEPIALFLTVQTAVHREWHQGLVKTARV